MKIINIILFMLLTFLSAGCERPGNESVDLVQQGVKCVESGQYDKALGFYKKAIEMHPESDAAYLQMALLYDEYLGDKTNAISAYRKYLKVSGNEVNRLKVEKWIRDASVDINKQKTSFSIGDSLVQNNRTDSSILREKQFAAIRRQLIDKYESKIGVLENTLYNTENQCAKLSNENIALRSDEKNNQIAGMLDAIASKESNIATLQTKIDTAKQEAYVALQSQKSLQSIITNLQDSLKLLSGKDNNVSELIKSNAYLLAINCELQDEIKNVKQDKILLHMQTEELKKKNIRKSEQNVNRPAVELTPELLQAFEDAKKDIFELRRRERFNRQEREKFIKTISSLRIQLSNCENSLKTARRNLDKKIDSNEKVKQLKIELDREQTALKYREKQLFDRTLQLKKMQQSYSNLKRQYIIELQKRDDNSTVNMPQKESSGNKSVVSTPVAQSKETYTVKSGDSLTKIAKKVYGDENKYKIIYRANRKTLKKINKLKVGQILIIPKVD